MPVIAVCVPFIMGKFLLYSFIVSQLIFSIYSSKCETKLPHIIYIVADDMGWNDVSFHGSDQIPTPNIDSLAYHGVILNRHYVQPLCTPSRASLMTGKYPLHTGIHNAFAPSQKAGLSLSEKLLPQYFKDIGYTTKIVGKWHLGFFKNEYTPLERGFDSHFGYWSGAISYYDHNDEDPIPAVPNGAGLSGHDFRRDNISAYNLVGKYVTDLLTEEAVNVIENQPQDEPLFLYLPHLAVHAGNQGKWLEAPQEEINKFSYITNPNRRTYAAMVSKLDQSIGRVFCALDRKDMLRNSIIVFISDNGAPNLGIYSNWGSNYPWRGQKDSLWEGAVRTPAVVWSPLIHNPSRVSDELMHITDWLPTLLAATGCNVKFNNVDGLNQWTSITGDLPSPREALVVDINQEQNMTAVIVNRFKYLNGPRRPNSPSSIDTFLNFDTIISPRQPKYNIAELTKSPTWQALKKFSNVTCLACKVPELRKKAIVKCHHNFTKVVDCTESPCLFNLKTDPCEQNNIITKFPKFVKEIQKYIDFYKSSSVPNIPLISDPASNPEYHNGSWCVWER